MLLINCFAFKDAQVWLLSKEGCGDGNHTVMQLAGFYVVWYFGTKNIFSSVLNGPPMPTSAWLHGMRINSILLMEVAELECSVNTFHCQIRLKPNCGWDLQKAKCCSYSTEPSRLAGVNLQLRLEAEQKKIKCKTQTYVECYWALIVVAI